MVGFNTPTLITLAPLYNNVMSQNNHYNHYDEEQYTQDLEEYKRSEPITEASYVYCPTCEKVHSGKCEFQQ